MTILDAVQGVKHPERLSLFELQLLQAQHNVNLHASDDEFIDFGEDKEDQYSGLVIVGEEEFFERFCQ